MYILAGLVLLFFCPWMLFLLQGLWYGVELIFALLQALFSLYNKPEVQKKPAPTKVRKPVDPETKRLNEMRRAWQTQGYRVGLVNLDTQEVFQPARKEFDWDE